MFLNFLGNESVQNWTNKELKTLFDVFGNCVPFWGPFPKTSSWKWDAKHDFVFSKNENGKQDLEMIPKLSFSFSFLCSLPFVIKHCAHSMVDLHFSGNLFYRYLSFSQQSITHFVVVLRKGTKK